GGDTVITAAVDGTSQTFVEQQRGKVGTVYRRSSTVVNGISRESADYLKKPFVALGDTTVTAMVTMPWMRYREPQALTAKASELSLRFISAPATVGEAQGVWGFGRLHFFEGNVTDQQMGRARDQITALLERGLLVHVPVEYLDSTRVM